MQIPLQITFRNMDPSEVMEQRIRDKARKLDRFYNHVMSCRVLVDAPHRNHQKGNLYHVRIDITVPDGELVVSRENHDDHSREDAYVAIRDAFAAAQRQLEEYASKRQDEVKTHTLAPHGRIASLNPGQNYGMILSTDGREIYFHRNSVVNESFDNLDVGMEVRFAEESGEQGPQASSVLIEGKRHVPEAPPTMQP